MFEPVSQTSEYSERYKLINLLETSLSMPVIRRRRLSRVLYNNSRDFWTKVSAAAKRISDITLAGAALILSLPLLFGLYLLAKKSGGGVTRTTRLGLAGEPFQERSFCFGTRKKGKGLTRSFWSKLPALVNVLQGEMSIIGPRPFSPDEVSAEDQWAWKRFHVRPGLICLWWIRRRANIAYRSETEMDAEYVDIQSMRGDVGIILRSIPAAFYGDSPVAIDDQIELLDIPINNVTMGQAIQKILRCSRENAPSQVCFVNADCVNVSYRDSDYKSILQDCGTVLADGIGVKLAGRLLKRNIRENVNGTDLLPKLCEQMQEQGIGVYLLGGKPGVAEDTSQWMQATYPRLSVRGCQHGYFSPDLLDNVLDTIKRSGAEVLLVAFGVPKQEKWIRDYLAKTGCKVGIGVGGLFDFYAGRVPRAPVWVREIGMEWFFRFWQEPSRMWRRYFAGNLLFLGRVFFRRLAESKIWKEMQ